ncbi:MAG: hypothetical protein N2444_03680 [Methylocystis sp.]|nr:hypothetical protein [Methylocystis sp.]
MAAFRFIGPGYALAFADHGMVRRLASASWGETGDPSNFGVGGWTGLHFEAAHLHEYEPPRAFIPRANGETALATVASLMNDEAYLDWLLSMAPFDCLEYELAELPKTFRSLYIAAAANCKKSLLLQIGNIYNSL